MANFTMRTTETVVSGVMDVLFVFYSLVLNISSGSDSKSLFGDGVVVPQDFRLDNSNRLIVEGNANRSSNTIHYKGRLGDSSLTTNDGDQIVITSIGRLLMRIHVFVLLPNEGQILLGGLRPLIPTRLLAYVSRQLTTQGNRDRSDRSFNYVARPLRLDSNPKILVII